MKPSEPFFYRHSYQKHEIHYSEYFQDEQKRARAESWMRTDTVDAWCRMRLMSGLNPILASYRGATWLTVGDGRFGSDAHYISGMGGEALATDISDVLLKEAVARGYVAKAQKENAEDLSFDDDQFDFVLCKDSFHHFPRPIIALYEMLRVARHGVVLIEPLDDLAEVSVGQILYRRLKEIAFAFFLRRKATHFQYEVVGNFIYGVSRREMEKIAVALDYPIVAFKGINNYYIDGIENELLKEKGPLYRRVVLMLLWRNFLSKLGLKSETVLTTLFLKVQPTDLLLKELQLAGYEVRGLPKNPYAES